ncbi:MAG: choice-of-anchor J domain-containing protein [Phycisphaerales bacterium]|nr:choice-of-anchor J domain-containing protein [Phycisphaerales bacterium]MCB9858045.1 choice-of-anchor J domain-containing protein [Phycisphaerales bacterium]MCB9864142.1 choice-of-anchor J domain-containing protein [Phycisphaerales bacterium]
MLLARSVAWCCSIIAVLAVSTTLRADTAWTAISGETYWQLDGGMLSVSGIQAKAGSMTTSEDDEQQLRFQIAPESSLTVVSDDGSFSYVSGGVLEVMETVTITTDAKSYEISKLKLRIQYDDDKDPTFVVSGSVESANETDLLSHKYFKPGFTQDPPKFYLEASDAIITEEFALAIDRTDLIGKPLGSFTFFSNLVWSGGDEPTDVEATPAGGAPRVPTVCNKPVGQDLIVGELYGPLENPAAQQIGGVWYDTFSVGTTSCNIGDVVLTWEGSSGFIHPAIGQNCFRLKDGRFEQIGQSWLKHGFAVAAGSACGCTCSGPGGGTLHPGCSDPYGGGLNNSQGSIKPKFRVNPTTGVHTHGSNPTFSGSVARRLMVRSNDLNPTLNPGALYFIEGHYVHQQDAGLDNDNNNASYRQLSISGSGNEYSASVIGTTQREECGIRAWKDTDPTVTETDVDIENDGLYIVCSKATDLGGGVWHYEYAVQNLNSNRGVKSFTIPISPAADVTNIGFHDVDYHDGDGDNSVDRDGTDWPGVFSNGTISWNMVDVGSNSNALLWGTMYNFRFDADVEPSPDLGVATLTHFRALPGNPDSVNAAVVVPQPYAVAMEIVGGAAPHLLATCETADIVLKIQDGAETFDPSSPLLWHSYDGGAFTSSSLVPMGGDLYMATLPAPVCGDSARYYFSAQSMSGTAVSLPVQATETETYFLANVGFEEINTYLETNFEAGLPAGWSIDGLWNIGNSCSSLPTGACGDSDGSNVAYFGQPSTCNYDTGNHENASITTPAIALPPSEQILLTYCSAFERHVLPIGDWPEVRVTPEGQATDLVDEPAVGAFVGGAAVWQQRVVDLTAYAGQTVTIAFNFDNLIATDDDHLGWMIDNVSVKALEIACIPGCGSPDGDMNVDGSANGADMQSFADALVNASMDFVDVAHGDFSGNGVIDMADVNQMVATMLGN